MHEFELIVTLVVAAVALVWLAEKLSLPYPMLLVVGGVVMAVTPWLPSVDLASEVVLIIFLPPILFQAAQTTSIRDFKANFAAISRLAFGLVLVTTVAVAVVIHWLVPELGWPAAFVLGAIVSPPDAVAATAIFQRLGAPSRIVAILEGESLINDASALVIYTFAVAAAVSGDFSAADALVQFPLVVAIGIGVGLVAGHLLGPLAMKMGDPSLSLVVLLIAPMAIYVVTEWLGGSGVLGVVVAGLAYGFHAPRSLSSALRVRSLVIWDLVTIVINGLVFLLIGLEVGDLAGQFDQQDLVTALGYAAATVATMMVVRFAYVYGGAAVGRLLNGTAATAEGDREQFVIAWSGLRGVVSLATALALPLLTDADEGFDHREQIILITSFVVVLTLFGLGLPLPWILRRLKFAEDGKDGAEMRLAVKTMSEAMYAQYLVESKQEPGAEPLLRPLLDRMLAKMQREPDAAEMSMLEHDPFDGAGIQQRAIDAARDALLGLRDSGQIGDEVLRQMEKRLDLQELQLMA